jgi:hypothetical protein
MGTIARIVEVTAAANNEGSSDDAKGKDKQQHFIVVIEGISKFTLKKAYLLSENPPSFKGDDNFVARPLVLLIPYTNTI